MSAPTIAETLVLPTLSLSLRVAPPVPLTGIGGSVTSYTVTIGDTVIPGVEYDRHDRWHFLARVGTLVRGSLYPVTVQAVGPGGTGSTSAPVTVEASPGASRAETVRQRIADLVATGDLEVQGLDVAVLEDLFGVPAVIQSGQAIRGAVVVEVGTPRSDEEVDSADICLDTVTVPIRIFVPAEDLSTGGAVVTRAAELVRRRLNVGGNRCLNLNRFGVTPGSVEFGSVGEVQASPDGRLMMAGFEVVVPVRYIATADLK